MFGGRWMPATSKRSTKCGRMPVGLSLPMILPSIDAGLLEDEDVLHDDDVALHALDLGDVRRSCACRP